MNGRRNKPTGKERQSSQTFGVMCLFDIRKKHVFLNGIR